MRGLYPGPLDECFQGHLPRRQILSELCVSGVLRWGWRVGFGCLFPVVLSYAPQQGYSCRPEKPVRSTSVCVEGVFEAEPRVRNVPGLPEPSCGLMCAPGDIPRFCTSSSGKGRGALEGEESACNGVVSIQPPSSAIFLQE